MIAPTGPYPLDLGSHQTTVALSGAGEPVFVCLHGLVDDLSIWDGLTPGLGTRGTVVRYDQRGHGTAGAPAGPYTRDQLGGDAVAVLDRLEIEQAILVGHSMGGIMAITTALNHPDRVAGLVLIGTTSQASAKAAAWYAEIADAGIRDGADGLAGAIYGPDNQRAINGDPAGIAEVTRTLEGLHTDPLTPHLVNITCPALLVVGEHDPLGVKATEICARNIPAAEIRVVDGAGHWVHVDRPDAVLDAYDAWSSR